jgi:hypothetical protein
VSSVIGPLSPIILPVPRIVTRANDDFCIAIRSRDGKQDGSLNLAPSRVHGRLYAKLLSFVSPPAELHGIPTVLRPGFPPSSKPMNLALML